MGVSRAWCWGIAQLLLCAPGGQPLREVPGHLLHHHAGAALDQRRQPPLHLHRAVDRHVRSLPARPRRHPEPRRRAHPRAADAVLALGRDRPGAGRLVQVQQRLGPERDAGRPELDGDAGVEGAVLLPPDDAGARHAADHGLRVREDRPDPLRAGRHVEALADLDHDYTSSPNQSRLYATLRTLRETLMSSSIGPSPARNSSTPACTSSRVVASLPRQPSACATLPRFGVAIAEARVSMPFDTNFWYSAPSASSLNTAISSLIPNRAAVSSSEMCISVPASPSITASGAPLSATAAPIAVGTACPMQPNVLIGQVSARVFFMKTLVMPEQWPVPWITPISGGNPSSRIVAARRGSTVPASISNSRGSGSYSASIPRTSAVR